MMSERLREQFIRDEIARAGRLDGSDYQDAEGFTVDGFRSPRRALPEVVDKSDARGCRRGSIPQSPRRQISRGARVLSTLRKVNDWLENSLIGAFIGAGMIVAFWIVSTFAMWAAQ